MSYRPTGRIDGIDGLGASLLGTAGTAGAAVSTGGVSLIPTVLANIPFVGSLLSGSDPKKDQERKDRIDGDFAGAMAGDRQALARLMCKAGLVTQDAIDFGLADPTTGCSLAGGSKVGRAYANQKYLEYKARVLAGTVGVTLIGQSPIPGQIQSTVTNALSSPLLLGGLAVGAYLLLRRRGR